ASAAGTRQVAGVQWLEHHDERESLDASKAVAGDVAGHPGGQAQWKSHLIPLMPTRPDRLESGILLAVVSARDNEPAPTTSTNNASRHTSVRTRMETQCRSWRARPTIRPSSASRAD